MVRVSHIWAEGVATNNLVEMGGGDRAGVDKGVDSVDDELGAGEAHHGGDDDTGGLGGGEVTR